VGEVIQRPPTNKNFVISPPRIRSSASYPKEKLGMRQKLKMMKRELIQSLESWLCRNNELLETEDSGFLIVPMSRYRSRLLE